MPRSLAAVSVIAAALATRQSVAGVIPGVLGTLADELAADDCALWLHGNGKLYCAWSLGTTGTSVATVDKALAGDNVELDDLCITPLLAGERVIGALSVRPGREISPEDRLFLTTIADLLGPAIRDAERAQRLETEVAEHTREIEAQRRFTANIIDSLPLGLYVIDRECRIQAWNRKRETGMQGVSREEAIGRPIFEILHRQPAELLRREFEDVFKTGEIQQLHTESTATGERRTYRITKIPMRLDGEEITHVITVGEDISEWRDSQDRIAQAEKLAAVGTLAAGVMHEINNPLATIHACAESLQIHLADGKTPEQIGPELREALSLIEQEVQRCSGIVGSLLDFSRPKPTTKVPVDVNELIERTLFLLKYHTRFKQLAVQLDLAPVVPPVLGNGEQLVQVFMALLLNAMDAMEGSGTIQVATRVDAEHHEVIAEIKDHGVGIRSADLPKIFDPFYTTKAPGRGTGLGLSICYTIVAEHGGRIEVDSIVDAGSVFRIVLPQDKE